MSVPRVAYVRDVTIEDDGISFPTWKKHYEGWAREWSEAFGSF